MLHLLLGIFVFLLVIEDYKKKDDLDEDAVVCAAVAGVLTAIFPTIMLLIWIICISYGLGKKS
jgi:hypothetical protein